MKLEDGKCQLEKLVGVPFEIAFTQEELRSVAKNKGRTGMMVQKKIGLSHDSAIMDFEDGELKTCAASKKNLPSGTVPITTIGTTLDDLLNGISFEDSRVFYKINNFLLITINRNSPQEGQWRLQQMYHVNLNRPEYSAIKETLKEDFKYICDKLKSELDKGEDVHTTSGKFLQIRTKDSFPYTPLYSQKLNRKVSNKGYAFFFKLAFLKEIHRLQCELS